MNTDLGTTSTTVGLLAAMVTNGAGTDTDSFDCATGRWTMLVGILGGAANDDIIVTVEDSADDATFAAVSGFSTPTVTAVDKGSFTILVDHRKVRRYVRLNVVRDGVSTTRVGVTALTYHGGSAPTNGVDLVVA